ncbi:MAG TPA: hypothetical protein VFM34_06985, partial [Moraxellaceae bacterium]|nr:hypothetical protein [Moraxellaceae bacterium]
RDREFNIGGGELIIYELSTRKVIAVSRTFEFTRRNPRRDYAATWLVSPTCANGLRTWQSLTIAEFAQRVLMEVGS